MPLINLSLLRDPFGPTHVSKRRFTFLTATSARPLDCGLYAEDSLWCTPHRDRNSLVAVASNSGPPSLDKFIGIPNVVNKVRR